MPVGSPQDSCEVLVVGGGLAGLEVANELVRRGAERVAVLEAGPAADLRHINVTHTEPEAHRIWLEPDADPNFHRPWISTCPPHYQGSSGLRRRLGGRSLYWYGIVLPVEDWALASPGWPSEVAADLTESWRGGASLYDHAISRLEAWRGEQLDDGSSPVALDALDLHRTPRAVRGAAEDGRWYAYSPLDAWRDPNSGALNAIPEAIHIYPDTEAIALLVDEGGAKGALVRGGGDGRSVEFRANIVVLAAGAIESARLAAQAIARRDPLDAASIGGVVDHLVQGAFVRLDRTQAGRLLNLLREGSWYAPCRDERSNLFLDLSVRPSGEAVVELQMTGEQLPSDASRISWDQAPGKPWTARVHSERTTDELALLTGQQRRLQVAWEALAAVIGCPATTLRFADYDAPENTNAVLLPPSIDALSPGQPETWCNQLGTEDHEACTLPMGVHVSDDHELLGVPGVFVAGPASLPRLGAANPALTTIALAHRLAAVLAERG